MSNYDEIQEAVAAIRKLSSTRPQVGVVLGSGLGGFADRLAEAVSIPYANLPHFPHASVPGHAGKLVVGTLEGQPLVAMQGRVHAYEGHPPNQVVLPVRTLCALGIHTLVVTNASGGIRADLRPGDLMAITDHINLSGWNPLTGPNDARLGPRFPDMSRTYAPELLDLLDQTAKEAGVELKRGIYAHVAGPTYETPAEVRMLRTLGGDATGMSTVPEVIAAAHMGARVAGVACITNLAAGLSDKPLTHEDVAEVARQAEARFSRLLSKFLPRASMTPSRLRSG
jgi:purine-nucleoside phosphorylase